MIFTYWYKWIWYIWKTMNIIYVGFIYWSWNYKKYWTFSLNKLIISFFKSKKKYIYITELFHNLTIHKNLIYQTLAQQIILWKICTWNQSSIYSVVTEIILMMSTNLWLCCLTLFLYRMGDVMEDIYIYIYKK